MEPPWNGVTAEQKAPRDKKRGAIVVRYHVVRVAEQERWNREKKKEEEECVYIYH